MPETRKQTTYKLIMRGPLTGAPKHPYDASSVSGRRRAAARHVEEQATPDHRERACKMTIADVYFNAESMFLGFETTDIYTNYERRESLQTIARQAEEQASPDHRDRRRSPEGVACAVDVLYHDTCRSNTSE